MGKSSFVSMTSINNVRFYSSTGTMGTYSSENSRLCQGPKRVICFCLLAVITPSLFISTVLLMRFVFNGTANYHINPSDMRILDHRISTTWCQSERIQMNTTFTAYLTSGEPKLIKSPVPLTTTKTLIIPDDHKEYWGFYLLKGSTFRIRTCSRSKGATLLIVRGRNHLEHCAYIGQADSAGDSDEFSNSGSLENQNDDGSGSRNVSSQRSALSLLLAAGRAEKGTGASAEEMSLILSKIRAYIRSRPKGYTKLKENLADWNLFNSQNSLNLTTSESESSESEKNDEQILNMSNLEKNIVENKTNDNESTTHVVVEDHPHKIRHENSRLHHNQHLDRQVETATVMESRIGRRKRVANHPVLLEHGTIRRRRRDVEFRKKSESGENGAFEDSSELTNNMTENGTVIKNKRGEIVGNVNSTKLTRSMDTPNSIWKKEHGHHIGQLNDTNPFQEFDGSDSESESSFSSSEEALARCEGVVASLYLKPTEDCGTEVSDEDIPLFYENTVNVSGYYYFIFGSENEKQDNFIRSRFELEKYVYDLPPPLEQCVDVTECHVNLTFWSNQKVRQFFKVFKYKYIDNVNLAFIWYSKFIEFREQMVVKIPQPTPEQEAIWDEWYLAESQCEPRVLLYLIFVVVVPVSIILCAFQ